MAASILSSSLNLTANLVGAGLLSLPWVLKEATLVTGLVILLIVGSVSSASFIILAKCCDLSGSYGFVEMAQQAIGFRFGVLVQICNIAYASCSCISYVVLCADFLVGEGGVFQFWAAGTWLCSKEFMMSICGCVVLFPLSLLLNIHPLRYTSTVTIAIKVLWVAFFCYLAMRNFTENLKEGMYPPSTVAHKPIQVTLIGFPSGVFAAIPVCNVSYCAHYNAPRLYQELSNQSIWRFKLVVAISGLLATTSYVLSAVSGYIIFGNLLQGDVMTNFSVDYMPAQAARLGYSFVVLFTFPLAHHSIRRGIIALCPRAQGHEVNLTAALVFVLVFLGTQVQAVQKVLIFKGAIFGSCIVFIFPSVILAAMQVQKRHKEIVTAEPLLVHDSRISCKELMSELFCCSWWLGCMCAWGLITSILGLVLAMNSMS